MNIRFDYEYDCGGFAYSKNVEIDKRTFEQDKLLVLVCSFMNTYGGYPGKAVDEYLHCKFPDVHTSEDMLSNYCSYNVYDCVIEDANLKNFYKLAEQIYNMTFTEARSMMDAKCVIYVKTAKGTMSENISIWEEN